MYTYKSPCIIIIEYTIIQLESYDQYIQWLLEHHKSIAHWIDMHTLYKVHYIIIYMIASCSVGIHSYRLDSGGSIRVGDFGLAEDVYASGYFRQNDRANVKLPYKWMALESLNDAIFTEKTDVVSVW